jgi:hypothetical protein
MSVRSLIFASAAGFALCGILACRTLNFEPRVSAAVKSDGQPDFEGYCIEVANYLRNQNSGSLARDIQLASNELHAEFNLPEEQSNSLAGELRSLKALADLAGLDPTTDSKVSKSLQSAYIEGANIDEASAWAFVLAQSFTENDQAAAAADGRFSGFDEEAIQPVQVDPTELTEAQVCGPDPIRLYTVTTGGNRTFGGMQLYKGLIVSDQFYVQRKTFGVAGFVDQFDFVTDTAHPLKQMAVAALLLTKQPYYEYAPEVTTRVEGAEGSSPWRLKVGASQRIIDALFATQSYAQLPLGAQGTFESGGPRISIFRGVNDSYDELSEVQAAANTAAHSDAPSPRMSDFGPFSSEFASPNYFTALGWASNGGSVVHYSATKKALSVTASARFNAQGHSALDGEIAVQIPLFYAGIEHNALEVAFLMDPQLIQRRFFEEFETDGGNLIPKTLAEGDMPSLAQTIPQLPGEKDQTFAVEYSMIAGDALIFRSPFCTTKTGLSENDVGKFSQTWYQSDLKSAQCYDLSVFDANNVPTEVASFVGKYRPNTSSVPPVQPAAVQP